MDDFDTLLEELKKADVQIDPHRADDEYGRFACITDPNGNRIKVRNLPPRMEKWKSRIR